MDATRSSPTRDLALVERLEKLYVAVVADCLDKVGVRDNVMGPQIRPIYPEARLAGYAVTVDVVEVAAPPVSRASG